MKRGRNDPLSIFSGADRHAIEKYVHHDFQISKKAPQAACTVSPLGLLMPLVIVRTVGFLKRSLPMPFTDKRIPNFQPFLDRLTLDTYPKVKALQRKWIEDGVSMLRGRMLCVALLITQIDLFYVNHLLTTHYALLEAMDVESIISVLDSWQGKTFLRSRFISMHLSKLKGLLRAFAIVTVPELSVPQFVAWLQRKEGKVKVFDGCGPFVPMVMARELVLYGFFSTVGGLTSLGKGQGSYKLFAELGMEPAAAIQTMREGFERAAINAWTAYLELNPNDAHLTPAIKTLLFRTPTVFELENMGCEGRKMLKVIKNDMGLFEGKRVLIKSFHTTLPNGQPKTAPPMHTIPLPRMIGEAMVVDEIALF